jgi:FdhD protein
MGTKEVRATRYESGAARALDERLPVEAPLQIQVNGEDYAATLRTPGADRALVRGLLFAEGIITAREASVTFEEIIDPESRFAGCLNVVAPESAIEGEVTGHHSIGASSSCGMCGTREARALEMEGPPLIAAAAPVTASSICAMMKAMEAQQAAFADSGASHGAAAFDESGKLLTVQEDIGRHNAVDKVIGSLLDEGTLNSAVTLTVSGRVSYEIVFKAYRAAIPIIAAVSAPSSMAVEWAERFGISVLGFCRDDRITVYSNARQVIADNALTPSSERQQ